MAVIVSMAIMMLWLFGYNYDWNREPGKAYDSLLLLGRICFGLRCVIVLSPILLFTNRQLVKKLWISLLIELVFCFSVLISIGCTALIFQKMSNTNFTNEIRRDFLVAMVHWSPRVQKLYWEYLGDSNDVGAVFETESDSIVNAITPLTSITDIFILVEVILTVYMGVFFVLYFPFHIYIVIRETNIEESMRREVEGAGVDLSKEDESKEDLRASEFQ
jgi:hypothetical protein